MARDENQLLTRARHRDVENAQLFRKLLRKQRVVNRFPLQGGLFHARQPVPRGETETERRMQHGGVRTVKTDRFRKPREQHDREFQPFGTVYAHQPDTIAVGGRGLTRRGAAFL